MEPQPEGQDVHEGGASTGGTKTRITLAERTPRGNPRPVSLLAIPRRSSRQLT